MLNGREIGERSTEPATVYVVRPTSLSFFGDRRLHLFLRADKQDFFAFQCAIANKEVCLPEHVHSLLKVHNVNPLAFGEYILAHLGVPLTCSVTEMYAGLQ